MSLVKVEGLVLRTKDLGEADRIVTLFTREKGKTRAAARGARRVRSSLLAVSQPFAHGTYLLFMNNRGLHTLSQGELARPFRKLREDLTCLAYASYFCELADMSLPEEEPNDAMFDLLLDSFSLLELGAIPATLVARWYEIQTMNVVGFQPELDTCVRCHKVLEQGVATFGLGFSVPGGGMLCAPCAGIEGTSVAVNGAVWATMRHLKSVTATKLHAFQPGDAALAVAERLLTGYIEYRLEKRLNALAFLQSVESIKKERA